MLRTVNNQDVWVSNDENLEIREGTHVRIRIANIQLQPEKLVSCPWPCVLLCLLVDFGLLSACRLTCAIFAADAIGNQDSEC